MIFCISSQHSDEPEETPINESLPQAHYKVSPKLFGSVVHVKLLFFFIIFTRKQCQLSHLIKLREPTAVTTMFVTKVSKSKHMIPLIMSLL